MVNSSRIPFYIKLTFIFVGVYLFLYTLYIGREILIPIVYSFIFSILLSPFVNFMERKKINRIAAISIAVLVVLICTGVLIYFIASQLGMFNNALPMMGQKFNTLQGQIAQWLSVHFNLSIQQIDGWFARTRSELMSNGNSMIGKTIVTLSGILVLIFLIPVYVFMILYYEPLLLVFTKKIFNKVHHEKLEEVLIQTKRIVQSYLNGLLIEAVIIGTLNSAALLIIGVDYAILLGIIGALLNMIPFIGGIIAVALPMAIALFTKDSGSYSILILMAYILIQFFDNHFITPKIVASKVRINALIAVIVVLIGNALWGIPGMFLAIPVTGILKVIFENIEALKPFAFLLGDTMPASGRYIFNFSKRKLRKLS
ncbi:MAG TPA: AI-2E family transporter [Puia sp.]|nr:AI-2E family transporter [Puia sp.]